MNPPTPYYDQDGITIYCGDNRKILPELGRFDLLLTDPPYGIEFQGKKTKHKDRTGGYATVEDSNIGPGVVNNALTQVKRGIVFPGTVLLQTYPQASDMGCIYCPSGAGFGPWGFHCFNPILFYGKRPGGNRSPSSMESFNTAPDVAHPCPKPIEWITWLLSLGAEFGDTVLDPFLGSGTTLVAAKLRGLRGTGIEINEDYCKIAVERLRQRVLITV